MESVPKEHQLKCSVCGQIVDMRDLSQVFAHEPCDGKHKDYNNIKDVEYSGSIKIGGSKYYTKNKTEIDLN